MTDSNVYRNSSLWRPAATQRSFIDAGIVASLHASMYVHGFSNQNVLYVIEWILVRSSYRSHAWSIEFTLDLHLKTKWNFRACPKNLFLLTDTRVKWVILLEQRIAIRKYTQEIGATMINAAAVYLVLIELPSRVLQRFLLPYRLNISWYDTQPASWMHRIEDLSHA